MTTYFDPHILNCLCKNFACVALKNAGCAEKRPSLKVFVDLVTTIQAALRDCFSDGLAQFFLLIAVASSFESKALPGVSKS